MVTIVVYFKSLLEIYTGIFTYQMILWDSLQNNKWEYEWKVGEGMNETKLAISC